MSAWYVFAEEVRASHRFVFVIQANCTPHAQTGRQLREQFGKKSTTDLSTHKQNLFREITELSPKACKGK